MGSVGVRKMIAEQEAKKMAMGCEHEFIKPVSPDFKLIAKPICLHCRKTQTEIDLEQQLAAANAELAELKKQNAELFPYYQDHCEGALIPATEYQQWIKRAEQAEAQCAAIAESYVSMQGDFQHYAYCKLIDSPPGDKCTCGVWEMTAAIENCTAGTAIQDRLHRMEGALRWIATFGATNYTETKCAKAALDPQNMKEESK